MDTYTIYHNPRCSKSRQTLELLREGVFSENTGVVVMTAFGGVQQAVEAMRLGAGDYLAKPFEPEELPLMSKREVAQRLLDRVVTRLAARLPAPAPQNGEPS